MRVRLKGEGAKRVYVERICPLCQRKIPIESWLEHYWPDDYYSCEDGVCKIPAYCTVEFFCQCGAHGWGDWTEELGWDIVIER